MLPTKASRSDGSLASRPRAKTPRINASAQDDPATPPGAEINSAAVADFFWEQRTAVKRFLVPRNGATFLVVGERLLESVAYADLQRLTVSSQPIDGSEGRENQLRPGTVIAYRTQRGHLGKLRIIQYGDNLVIRWTTYALTTSEPTRP